MEEEYSRGQLLEMPFRFLATDQRLREELNNSRTKHAFDEITSAISGFKNMASVTPIVDRDNLNVLLDHALKALRCMKICYEAFNELDLGNTKRWLEVNNAEIGNVISKVINDYKYERKRLDTSLYASLYLLEQPQENEKQCGPLGKMLEDYCRNPDLLLNVLNRKDFDVHMIEKMYDYL